MGDEHPAYTSHWLQQPLPGCEYETAVGHTLGVARGVQSQREAMSARDADTAGRRMTRRLAN